MTQIELRVQRKEMEVVVPAAELHFHTATTTPYMSAPSSPTKRFASDSCFDFYNSAPTSPSAAAAFYSTLRDIAAAGSDWKEMPGKDLDLDFDAAFNFSGRSATLLPLTDADDLFEFGIIRPLKLPPRLCTPAMGEQSLKSPMARGLLSPLRRGRGGKDVDPFAAAMLEVTKSRKGSRSLSPLRGRGGFFHTPKSSPSHPVVNNPCVEKGSAGNRKWRLKDLLLFGAPWKAKPARSEGIKDHLICKYTSSSSSSSSSQSSMKRNKVSNGEDSMSSSFRSSVDSGSVLQEGATAEEMKKKMAVQRRQSIFGQFRLTAIFSRSSFNRGRS